MSHRSRLPILRVLCLGALGLAPAVAASAADPTRWEGYLDYAYVYSSADADTLQARLDEYGRDAGLSLDDYILETYTTRDRSEEVDEATRRREAIAYLLQYLATREPQSLDRSVEAIEGFEESGRHENRYWYRYVLAHRALERGNANDFVEQCLQLWMEVVLPLESPYETLQALSLSQSSNSGFVAALPYVFENLSRLVLIRSQEMGLSRGLDPLAAVVRMLADGRVGAHPDVIPPEASSRGYLERIIARLDGTESDGGSLGFTLALFEAGRYHEKARGLLASEGFGAATLEAIGVASGAYETALNLAETAQGRSAVYTRVLRQIGEVYAAKQRLGEDPYVETPFTIEGAIAVYDELYAAREHGWEELGFRAAGREAYVAAMHRLWEEIQETSLNAADFYLTRALEQKERAEEHIRNASRMHSRYIGFFEKHAHADGAEMVPDSAYFAAYEAGRGFGDAYLEFWSGDPTPAEMELITARYRSALAIYPFDRALWPALAGSLERQGRSNEFLGMARPLADAVARSRHVHGWIEKGEPGHAEIDAIRRALSDDLVLMYLGFADASGMDELERSLDDLRARRDGVVRDLQQWKARHQQLAPGEPVPAAPADGAALEGSSRRVERAEMGRKIEDAKRLLEKLERQIEARSRALPLYKATTRSDGLAQDLRARRDHPVHTLLRRMFYETEL